MAAPFISNYLILNDFVLLVGTIPVRLWNVSFAVCKVVRCKSWAHMQNIIFLSELELLLFF